MEEKVNVSYEDQLADKVVTPKSTIEEKTEIVFENEMVAARALRESTMWAILQDKRDNSFHFMVAGRKIVELENSSNFEEAFEEVGRRTIDILVAVAVLGCEHGLFQKSEKEEGNNGK